MSDCRNKGAVLGRVYCGKTVAIAESANEEGADDIYDTRAPARTGQYHRYRIGDSFIELLAPSNHFSITCLHQVASG